MASTCRHLQTPAIPLHTPMGGNKPTRRQLRVEAPPSGCPRTLGSFQHTGGPALQMGAWETRRWWPWTRGLKTPARRAGPLLSRTGEGPLEWRPETERTQGTRGPLTQAGQVGVGRASCAGRNVPARLSTLSNTGSGAHGPFPVGGHRLLNDGEEGAS